MSVMIRFSAAFHFPSLTVCQNVQCSVSFGSLDKLPKCIIICYGAFAPDQLKEILPTEAIILTCQARLILQQCLSVKAFQ